MRASAPNTAWSRSCPSSSARASSRSSTASSAPMAPSASMAATWTSSHSSHPVSSSSHATSGSHRLRASARRREIEDPSFSRASARMAATLTSPTGSPSSERRMAGVSSGLAQRASAVMASTRRSGSGSMSTSTNGAATPSPPNAPSARAAAQRMTSSGPARKGAIASTGSMSEAAGATGCCVRLIPAR